MTEFLCRTFEGLRDQAFDRLVCSAEISQLNFEPRDFSDARGKPQHTIQMTKDCSTASATACGRNALLGPEYQRLNFEPLIETYTAGNGATQALIVFV